ncbi:hypothetical protein CPB84DRAFT_1792323 [Gymnopilus junonius]|uniref:Expansin n=1 Tax=Gymnopilus junonius TaxID=109634 RepID=A0A9P5NCR4_GYMJU|nr:hypothetical protein CPB84DRAFT_1792323 [Gymnopilus junonius]
MHSAIFTCIALVLLLANTSSALTLRRDGHFVDLESRQEVTNARLSFYNAGGSIGSCGVLMSNTAFEWANGAHCFQLIAITANGKTTQAQIVDECPTCPSNGLALTIGLFEFFASTSVGVITGSWVTTNGSSIP